MTVAVDPLSPFRIVPVLAVGDAVAARQMLTSVFGFTAESETRLRCGDQVIVLQAAPDGVVPGHGPIDHLALAVGDADLAMRALLASGGQVDPAVTPGGPLEISQFWAAGVRYVFFTGPDGARIELCALLGQGAGDGSLRGHDHFGISCRNIAASEAFYAGLGMVLVFSATLATATGEVPVRFMRRGGYTVELYSPPERRRGAVQISEAPLWQGLRFEGYGRDDSLTGPDGEHITLLV